ncbi:MAG: biopolymer transporter ExbD [Gammaproteobacteria bacterium]|nr:biopolymer transporter ExbD [Gammaproteobacteria bacterium]MDH5800497.1 biopolymer transporter ExbD [Gammaproteobacteria bacterium]
MSRRHHYKAKSKEPPEMDITTFLNLMVVLIPFLLISAVFSRITIMELNLPAGAAAGSDDKAKVTIEVIVRAKKLEIGNGKGIVAVLPNVEEEKYDVQRLSDYLQKIKNNYPDKTDATIMLEPDIEYEKMVRIMDVVRSYEIPPAEGAESAETQKIALFPDMSIGEAP